MLYSDSVFFTIRLSVLTPDSSTFWLSDLEQFTWLLSNSKEVNDSICLIGLL